MEAVKCGCGFFYNQTSACNLQALYQVTSPPESQTVSNRSGKQCGGCSPPTHPPSPV